MYLKYVFEIQNTVLYFKAFEKCNLFRFKFSFFSKYIKYVYQSIYCINYSSSGPQPQLSCMWAAAVRLHPALGEYIFCINKEEDKLMMSWSILFVD